MHTCLISCTCFAQGEDQKKLDVLANEVFINMLAKSGQCAVIVSMDLCSEWDSLCTMPWFHLLKMQCMCGAKHLSLLPY